MDVVALVTEWTIDAWTVVVGLFCVVLRWFMQGRSIRKDECVVSFLNGATMVPFFVLAVSVFSPALLDLALAAKGPTALAGCVGIFFVLGETLSPRDLRRPTAKIAVPPESLPD
ncbi:MULTISPECIES: hypothetical protein [Pseudomonas syringae group]|uniref:hypothetical protein n=1 Tax=Pseudomonas syringae group TaxID=136849 RepID=UPI00190FD708|nr:hypothetical protein [Pseudomonas cichorii]MBX8487917.1 hypothetical protein [Pseudomonas cichorii]MBX8497975.1 hypothetical protein [Pseudomonas cichorii]MBX8517704.1 hypothetical protein [Pseudomonas cichorii]MBX8532556.1 hypothetical protein [Pseudomonas cichorii]GFM68902.1 hypothetical protein PSCICJ_50200 [Pseudomonas cichorii]